MFDNYSTIDAFKEQCGYTIDGAWYPRVTKILSIKAKPALYRYYGDAVNFKAAQEVTEKSAAEGTLVHEAAEAILLGHTPETIDPLIRPAIKAFQEFLERNNIHSAPEWVERRIIHMDERYAGTIDALALIDGRFGVLDIKTSQGIYRDYNLQTAAYMDALKGEFQNLQTRWILRIDQIDKCVRCRSTRRTKGGREKVRRNGGGICPNNEHEWGETEGVIELQEFPFWQSDYEAFLGAKKLWEWENETWLKKAGYL
jgi:hypothetical protein